jgi:hypothetical protein
MGLNLPRPDYSKTEAEVFEETAREIIQKSKSLDILSQCIQIPAKNGLPSWVPDWSTKLPPVHMPWLRGNEFLLNKNYAASGNTNAVLGHGADPGRIKVPGVTIAQIESLAVSSVIGPYDANTNVDRPRYYDFAQACQKWCQSMSQHHTYCDGRPAMKAARCTLLLLEGEEAVCDSGPTNNLYKFHSFSEWFDLLLYPNCKLLDPEVVKSRFSLSSDDMRRYYPDINPQLDPDMLLLCLAISELYGSENEIAASLLRWANHALMVLDTGHFARGFHICREGDMVALLAGCTFPVALRPDGNGNFRFVAPLYVDGIMHGEAWPKYESEWKEIVLV